MLGVVEFIALIEGHHVLVVDDLKEFEGVAGGYLSVFGSEAEFTFPQWLLIIGFCGVNVDVGGGVVPIDHLIQFLSGSIAVVVGLEAVAGPSEDAPVQVHIEFSSGGIAVFVVEVGVEVIAFAGLNVSCKQGFVEVLGGAVS